MLRYFASITIGKVILWCYLLWYLVTVFHYFDPSITIWLNSLGISVVIGFALMLSVGGKSSGPGDGWQAFRLFLMPFCVSSFSSLIKNQGFILILPPTLKELLISVGVCTAFIVFVIALKHFRYEPKA